MPNLSMYHLVHTNQDIKRRQNKDEDSTVDITEYWSKRNPTIKSCLNQPQTQHQAIPFSSIDMSLSRKHHRVRHAGVRLRRKAKLPTVIDFNKLC